MKLRRSIESRSAERSIDNPVATLAAVRFDDVPTVDEHVRLHEAGLRALDEAGRPWPALSTALTHLEHAAARAGTADARWRLAVRRGDVLARRGRLDEAVVSYQAAEGLGCETGVPGGGGGGGMSLALAFLVAGAEEVVATPEKTVSEVSLPTALGLLERMSPTTPDLARDLAATQAAMLTRGEQIGRYRVWVR